MKCEIAPAEVSELRPFPCSINSTYVSKTSEAAFGGISKNGLWIWIIQDTTINIYHTENSEWFGGYCFGESLKNPLAKITAVSEFSSTNITFPCLLIAVNNDHESLICMYNVNISKVVRSILIPDRVLSIEVISGNGGACMDTYHLYIQLRYMFGIIALGSSSGHMYFLDLCLDEDFSCDENSPDITYVVNKYELIPERRERAISKQQHVFILLNDQSTRSGLFELESRSSSLGHFPYGKAHVTALKYIPSTVTLAVGFNFGGTQLWNLQDLCLLYTFAYEAHQLPVITFAFQEPENDPRNFCYLWIIRGYSANERSENASVASMYSLTYCKKTYEESYGNLYTDIQSCSKRFEYTLTNDPVTSAQSSSFVGSCILSCQTVCQTDESHTLDASSMNDSDTAPENMSLCFISWLVWSNSEISPTSYHLALFDLNQWYQAQMPASNYRCDPSDLNPFLSHYSLEDVVQNFDEELLLGLYVVPHNIRKFKFISPAEEFFYPSSLDFQTVLYSAHATSKATFLGLQKSLLYKIAEMGPNVLINPKEFYTDLIQYGLVSDPTGNGERVPLITQREMILHLALEYHLPYFFMKCLKEWRYADSIQEGCTSRALLNWSWRKVIQIKSSIDKLSLPFFNCSGLDVDKASLKCLYSYRRQLDLIDTILTGYQKFAAPRTEQGIQELKCKKDVVFSINTYLQVILWLRSVHILPEISEGDETAKNVLYPVSALINSYNRRRSDLRYIHSSIGPTDILLIDGLVKEAFSENTWQEKGGNGIYPPPSIYAALSCYLLDGVHLDLKHSLMYYLLLDICYSSPKNSFISEVKKFPAVFEMSQSVAKLVKAFWCLDQLKFEVAIKKLLHPAVKASDILPWQHRRVIKSFLFRSEAQKALRYINHMDTPENTLEDVKLHLSVLLGRRAIIQAFEYQRSKQAEGFGKELLNHLFQGCQEIRKLKDLMYIPLNAFESSSLVKFLSENDDPCAQEALVMYHLLRCNFFEAAKVNEKLAISLSGKTLSTNQRTADREALLEGLLSSVPKTEKNLVNEINRFPSIPVRRGDVELKPLSLSVKNAPLKQISYSDILSSLISDANSAMCAPYLEPQTPLKAVVKSNYDSIPFLRPPLAPEFTRPSSEVTVSTPVIKRALHSPSSEYSSPSKKSRLLDNAAFRTSSMMKKKIPKHLAGDVASLLQSPPIHRRSSKVAKDGNARDSPTVPPQGILKKKIEPSKVPVPDIYTSRTPSVLSDVMESDDDADAGSEKMIVDEEINNDVPGRQIRFSVPLKEDLNASAFSTSDADSSMLSLREEPTAIGTSNQPTDFVKRIEDMKSISLRASFSDREFINVTRRKSLFNLTREPLKSHTKDFSEIQLPLLESKNTDKASSEFSAAKSSSNISSPSLRLKDDKITKVSIENSPSDNLDNLQNIDKIISTRQEDESKQNERNSQSAEVSNYSLSSAVSYDVKKTALTREALSHLSSTESILNQSGSSSGNSSYNSASERSLIITPRRPLRDRSRNVSTSDTSVISSVEEKIDDTLKEKEKHDDTDIEIIDDESDEPAIKEYDDTDIKIVDEVLYNPDKRTNKSGTGYITYGERSDDSDIKIIEDVAVEQCKGTISSEKGETHIEKSYISVTKGTSEQIITELPVYQTLSTVSENSEDNFVNVGKEMETTGYTEEIIDNQNQGSAEEKESNIAIEEELSYQTDEMETNASENVPSTPETRCEDSITVGSECATKPSQGDNYQISSSSSDVSDFQKDISSVANVHVYVPIRERINRTSYKDTSEFQIFGDLDDLSRGSLSNSSHKQLEQLVQDSVTEPVQVSVTEPVQASVTEPVQASVTEPIQESVTEPVNKSVTEGKTSNLAEQLTTLLIESVPEPSQGGNATITKFSNANAMDIEESEISESVECKEFMSTPTSTPSREYFTGRFDFLSKNSDLYENSKLYKEAMNILKESDISETVEVYGENKSSRQTKTFIFSKERAKSSSKSGKKAPASKDSNSKSDDEKPVQKEFLESCNLGTYEQFSSSLAKDGADVSQKMNLRSSPNTDREKSSTRTTVKSDETEHQTPETKGRLRKEDSPRKNTSIIGRKKQSSIKKAKEKGKLAKKMEFSFADPHSPAGPEILEALTSPPEHPVGSFMFSPPLTRRRLRQKKLDETLGSSFASVASETSFGGRTKKPPVDPILEEIIAEKSADPRKPESLTPKSQTRSTKKKTTVKKSRLNVPQLDNLDSSLDVSKLVDVNQDLSTSKVLSSVKYTGKHKMVLRQAKVKPRKEQI